MTWPDVLFYGPGCVAPVVCGIGGWLCAHRCSRAAEWLWRACRMW